MEITHLMAGEKNDFMLLLLNPLNFDDIQRKYRGFPKQKYK